MGVVEVTWLVIIIPQGLNNAQRLSNRLAAIRDRAEKTFEEYSSLRVRARARESTRAASTILEAIASRIEIRSINRTLIDTRKTIVRKVNKFFIDLRSREAANVIRRFKTKKKKGQKPRQGGKGWTRRDEPHRDRCEMDTMTS